jgi:adenylate cyclase class 2
MDRSTREVEVKLPFDSPAAAREQLEAIGARVAAERYFEDNFVFDGNDGSLATSGILLRLRRVEDRATITLKMPVEGTHRHKVREEHQTRIEDPEAAVEIFRGLGLSSRYRYQKHRTKFLLGGLTICLDETPIGCFVELEGPPDEIDTVALRLGFEPDRYVCESYLDLHERVAREQGIERGDLLVEAPEKGS